MKYRYARYVPRYRKRYFGEVALSQLQRSGVELDNSRAVATGYRLDENEGFVSTGAAALGDCAGAVYCDITPLYVYEFRTTAVILPEGDHAGSRLGDIYITARCREEEVPYYLPEDHVDTVEAFASDFPTDGLYGDYYYVRGAPVGDLYVLVGGRWRAAAAYTCVKGRVRRVRAFSGQWTVNSEQ